MEWSTGENLPLPHIDILLSFFYSFFSMVGLGFEPRIVLIKISNTYGKIQ
jgi:hypothetical protein